MELLINQLRRKGFVVLGEHILEYAGEWRLLKPGDVYLAQSEGGDPELLTFRRVEVRKRTINVVEGKIFPKERKKRIYDINECVRIIVRPNPNPIPEPVKEEAVVSTPTVRPEPRKEKVGPRPQRPDPRDSNQKISYNQAPRKNKKEK